MTGALRIVVADDHADSRVLYGHLLRRLGHEVVGDAENGSALESLFEQASPDLVISDINMPLRDGISATDQIWKKRPVPIILISGDHDAQLLKKVQLDHVMGYLVKPMTLQALEDAIQLARERFAQFLLVSAEAKNAHNMSDDWRNVCQAKQLLAKTTQLREDGAFDRLQSLARNAHQSIAQTARTVVAAYNVNER